MTATTQLLRGRLAAAISRGSLDLTDDLLEFPLLTDLLGTGLKVRSTKLTDAPAAGATLTGRVDVLGAKAVALELTVTPDPDALTAELRLTLPATASWSLPGLSLTGVELVVRLSGTGPDRLLAGALTATSDHGPVALSVFVPGGARPWVLGLRAEGPLLAVLPELAGDAWAQVVGGDGAPLADLSAVDHVELTVGVDPATRSVERVTVDLAAPLWPLTERVALTDLAVHLAVDHPGEAARRRIELTVDAAVTADTAAVPVRVARRATGGWDLALGGDNGDTPPTLPQLLAAFGGPELAAAMPSELAELPAVRLGDLAARITGERLQHLSLTVFADWDVLPGRLTLRDGTASVDVTDPMDAVARRVALHVAGTADVFGVSVEIAADKDADAPLTLRGGLAPGTVASLHAVLAQTVGSVPPEVPDVTVTLASVTVTPQTGALRIDAACEVPWALPFGLPGLLVGRTELHLDRAPDTAPGVHAPLTASVTLTGSGTVGVCDGLDVTGLALSFVHDAAGWVLSGELDVTVLDHAYTLGARLTDTPTSRTFEFWERLAVPADPAVVDLGVGTLSLAGVSIRVSRGTAGGLTLDPASAYAWQLRVDGHAELATRAVVLDGSVELRGAPGRLSLALAPARPGGSLAELDVPLPAAESVHLHLAVDELTLTRTTTSWTARAGAGLWFSGLPGDAARVLPSSAARRLVAHLDLRTGADAAVAVVVERPLPVQDLALGTLEVEGRSIDLGIAAFELHRVELRWRQAGGLEVAAEIGIGLPAVLNDVLGAAVFLTYDPARPESLVRLRLSATTEGPALDVTTLTSAVHGLTLTPVHPDRPDDPARQATLRLGDYGTLTFGVPSIGYRTGTFRARGGFTQRDLALPLGPLRWVLDALGLGALNRVVPDRLSLENLSFLDAAGTLAVDPLADAIAGPLRDLTGVTVTDEVRAALHVVAMRTQRLPERLRPYLGVTIPESFAFDVAATASGGFVGSVGVGEPGRPVDRATTTPVRLLMPGLAATGPVLNGVELWRLSAGEILGGTALLVRADLTLDQFDLLPLAALLAIPDAFAAKAPDPSRLTRRLTVRNLVLLVVPEALVAAPVFFDELSVEYRGVEGAELGLKLAFPEPELDLGQALSRYHQVKEFFTSPDALLDDDPAPGLDLALTAGPAYLTLPPYLGGATLGDRFATTTISAGASLAHLLNGLKTLRLDELFAALPTDMQAGALPAVAFGPLTFAGTWRTGTPAGQRRGMAAHVEGRARLGTFAELDAQLDLHSSGISDVGGGFTVDGRLGPVTMHLDGALAAGGAPSVAPQSAVSFDSPSARVTPGPTWTPDAFTVEFWLDPSAVADYDQFVSGHDVWGSFVFHTTADGAVYTGTDVATRLTPAELPAGTIQVGRWQHVAVSYDGGVITFYRDGVRLATKAGLTPPQPWTGMHLGISVVGTQIAGRIAELRVWDSSRGADAISGLMNRRANGTEAGLVGCWHLDGPPTAPIADSGPSGWHGVGSALTAAAPSSPVPAPAAGGVAALTGHSALSLAGRRIFTGTVDVQPGRFLIDGQLDLFPGSSRADMLVSGRLSGVVDGGHVGLHGAATVRLAGLTLAAATVDITTTSVAVHGTWLDTITTDLTVSTTQVGGATNTVLTGIVTGSWVVDTSIGPVFDVITGAKLADAFHLSGSVTLGLRVTVGDGVGFSAAGRAVVTVGGTPVPLDIILSVSPASLDELKQAVLTQISAAATAFFRVLFHDGAAWAQGLVQKGFTWLETAGDDTVRALRAFGISTAAEASSIMVNAGFVGDDIGTVLRRGFVTTSEQLLDALGPTGLNVNAISRAVYAGFEAPLHRELFTATSAVVSMMRGRYGATLMASVAHSVFGLNDAFTVKALKNNGYIGRELVAAANSVLGATTPDRAARLMNVVGLPAKDTAQGLIAVFPSIKSRDVGAVLQGAGFRISDLNAALHVLGLPGI